MKTWLNLLSPVRNTTSLSEKLLSGMAIFICIVLIIVISQYFIPLQDIPFIVISMGASAVLLFAIPLGPLSQPWSFVGGHLISGFIGISVAKFVPNMIIAAALAVSLSVFFMYISHCLHPPGGAIALATVMCSPSVHHLGYGYLLMPVSLNLVIMLVFALIINNLIPNRYYPNTLKAYREEKNKTASDQKIEASLSVNQDDIHYALREMNEFIDISEDDLSRIFRLSLQHAHRKKMGDILMQDIMTRSVIKAEYGTDIEELWQLMAKHKIQSIPIVDRCNRVEGIVTIADFLNQVKIPTQHPLKTRLESFLKKTTGVETDKPEYAGHIMQKKVISVYPEQHILDLFLIFYEKNIHHLPVIDHDRHILGMITPKNVLIALHAELQS